MDKPTHGANDTLRAFDAKLAAHSMRGQWTAEPFLQASIGGPQPAGKPYLWAWPMVEKLLEEAGAALPESMEARRSLLFNNPGLQSPTATLTMNIGIQQILPGETAWAHRHSIAALRFIVDGAAGASTVVNGEVCPMEDFDLILTPTWTWHDHNNKSAKPVSWVDVVDIPLLRMLNQVFYQPYDKISQAERKGAEKKDAGAENTVRYPWREMEPKLKALLDRDDDASDEIALEYVNPVTGGSVLPTMGASVQWLKPGQKTARHRHTSSTVYFAMRGEGRTTVGDETLNWKARDCFVVPNWSWHTHENLKGDGESLLFSVTDAPLLKALGLYREEAEGTAPLK